MRYEWSLPLMSSISVLTSGIVGGQIRLPLAARSATRCTCYRCCLLCIYMLAIDRSLSPCRYSTVGGSTEMYLLRGICKGTESRQFTPDLGLILPVYIPLCRYPQLTIFDNLKLNNVSFSLYVLREYVRTES